VSEYLQALASLQNAERVAARYPTASNLQQVIAAQRHVTDEYRRLSAEARSKQPVRIGMRRPGYLETRARRVPRAEYESRRTDL
jgi:hypothetical protein